MIRLLVRMAIAVVANAVGLLVAAAVLDDVHVNAGSFFVAVLIFTIVFALMSSAGVRPAMFVAPKEKPYASAPASSGPLPLSM